MEVEEKSVQNHEEVLQSLLKWFIRTISEAGNSRKVFTILGYRGSGKTYVCEMFQNELRKANDNLEFVWTRFIDSNEKLYSVLEELNHHSCRVHKCAVEKTKHHQELLIQQLKLSDKSYMYFIPTEFEGFEIFFQSFANHIAESFDKNKLRIVLMCKVNEEPKDLGLNRIYLQPLNYEESIQLAQNVCHEIPTDTVKKLIEITNKNPMLLYMSSCIIREQSVLFGASGQHFLAQLKAQNTDRFPHFSNNGMMSTKLLNYIWNHLGNLEEFGKFAQQLLVLTVFLKPHFPIEVFRELKFPPSAYDETAVVPSTPVAELACTLLEELGLLIVSSFNTARVSNVIKNYINSFVLDNDMRQCACDLIVLNMRLVDGFVPIVPHPLEVLNKTCYNVNNDNNVKHLMAILRNPFKREQIAYSLGITVENLLDKIEIGFQGSKDTLFEERSELAAIRAENKFYMGDFEAAIESLQKVLQSSEEGSFLYLRIVQTLVFFLETRNDPRAEKLFEHIMRFNMLGVADEESLGSNKLYFHSKRQTRTKEVEETSHIESQIILKLLDLKLETPNDKSFDLALFTDLADSTNSMTLAHRNKPNFVAFEFYHSILCKLKKWESP